MSIIASPLSPRACRTVAADLASHPASAHTPNHRMVAVVHGDTPTDIVDVVGAHDADVFAERVAAVTISPDWRAVATITVDGDTRTVTVVATCGCSHAVTAAHTTNPSWTDPTVAMLRGTLGLYTPTYD